MTDQPRRFEIQFDTPLRVLAAEGGESEKRTISGMAVPWGVPRPTMFGDKVEFAKDSISVQGTPVILHHAPDRPIGVVKGESSTAEGLDASAKISAVRDGDEALVLAGDGVLRGFSVGVNPTEWTFNEDTDVLTVVKAETDHLALVVSPAFRQDQGQLKVAASAARPKEEAVDPTVTETAEAPTVVAAAPRNPITTASRMPTAGEFLLASVRRTTEPEAFARMQAAVQAAAPHTLSPDVAGLSPEPITGSLIDLHAPAARPVAEAFGILAAPSGVKSFLRPRIDQRLAAAATAPEKTDVTDGPMKVSNEQVTLEFIKRAANVSAEALAFTSADVMGLLAADLARAYLLGFDAVVTAALRAGATGDPVVIDADGSDATEKLYGAAAQIFGVAYVMPDLLLLAPDVWASLGSMNAADGRPLFPYAGPSNASGTSDGMTGFGLNLLGLRPVVTHGLAPGEAFLAVRSLFEVYESSRVSMRADEPTVLGTSIGIGGAVGTYVTEGDALVPVEIQAP